MNKLFYIMMAFLACLYFTCIGDDNIDPSTMINEFTPQFNKNSTIYVWLDNFRVREKPDLSSKVIHHLQFADEVKYLGETSKIKSKITLRGVTYNAPWIKITTKGGKEFWTETGEPVVRER